MEEKLDISPVIYSTSRLRLSLSACGFKPCELPFLINPLSGDVLILGMITGKNHYLHYIASTNTNTNNSMYITGDISNFSSIIILLLKQIEY